jgi:secreted PhoX family phosphatase
MSKALSEEIAGTNPSQNETFEEVSRRRLSRRGFLKGAVASAPLVIFGSALLTQPSPAEAEASSTLTFEPIPLSTADAVVVPEGYATQVVIRWGEPLHPDVPPLDILNQKRSRRMRALWAGVHSRWHNPLLCHPTP